MKKNIAIHKIAFKITCLAISLMSSNLYANKAGQLLQQMEQQQQKTQLPKVKKPLIPKTEQAKPSQKGETITVKSFKFIGNKLIDSTQLNLVLVDYIDRPISFSELQQTANKIAEHYRESGWIVRAYLPKQDITEGIVSIQIIEAIFGGAEIKGGDSVRVGEQKLLDMIAESQTIGETLNIQELDRALLLMDDLPGVTLTGSLKKGSGENETNISIETAAEPFVAGNLGFNNFGARSTGYEQLVGNLYFNSPFKLGDQGTVNYTHSKGNDYIRLAYSIPVANDGWRIGTSFSYLHYDLVQAAFKELDANGSSFTLGLDAKYPIIRSRTKNLYLNLDIDHKQFDNEANASTTTAYGITSFSMGFSGNIYDSFIGGGANSAGLNLVLGEVQLGEINLSENSELEGSFTKFTYYISRQQAITDYISLYGSLSGQQSAGNLDSSEKMYLGGAYAVRAYPVNEAGGDDGQLINIELRNRLPYNFNLTGFYDWGHVTVNHDKANNAPLNDISLQGAGISLGWQSNFGLNLNFTWAHRLGSNPFQILNGTDLDGTLNHNRYWLQASMAF